MSPSTINDNLNETAHRSSGIAYWLLRHKDPSSLSSKEILNTAKINKDEDEEHLRPRRQRIVFLHGFLQSCRRCWRSTAINICTKLGHDGIMIDFPGHGNSMYPELPVLQLQVAIWHVIVRRILVQVGWDDGKYLTIAGISIGGAVAANYVACYGPINRVIMIANPGHAEPFFPIGVARMIARNAALCSKWMRHSEYVSHVKNRKKFTSRNYHRVGTLSNNKKQSKRAYNNRVYISGDNSGEMHLNDPTEEINFGKIKSSNEYCKLTGRQAHTNKNSFKENRLTERIDHINNPSSLAATNEYYPQIPPNQGAWRNLSNFIAKLSIPANSPEYKMDVEDVVNCLSRQVSHLTLILSRFDFYHRPRPSVWTNGRVVDAKIEMVKQAKSTSRSQASSKLVKERIDNYSSSRQKDQDCYYLERVWAFHNEVLIDKREEDPEGKCSLISCMWRTHETLSAHIGSLKLETYPHIWAPIEIDSNLQKNHESDGPGRGRDEDSIDMKKSTKYQIQDIINREKRPLSRL